MVEKDMGRHSAPVASGDDGTRITVYFSLEEGWIHVLYFNWTADSQLSSHPCKSTIMPYSESQMRYLRARANAENSIYIFQVKRDRS